MLVFTIFWFLVLGLSYWFMIQDGVALQIKLYVGKGISESVAEAETTCLLHYMELTQCHKPVGVNFRPDICIFLGSRDTCYLQCSIRP